MEDFVELPVFLSDPINRFAFQRARLYDSRTFGWSNIDQANGLGFELLIVALVKG